jgi:hypothetical protein
MWNSHDHEGTVLDWESFEAKVTEINRETEELRRTRDLPVSEPLYRGQRDARWHLTTTLDRRKASMTLDKYLTIMERIQPRIERVSGKKWPSLKEEISELRRNGLHSIWLFPVKSANTETILSFMVYLRQHGFPSPLLDWTSNPYKAVFFAFSGIEPDVKGVAVYVFREWVGLMTDAKKEDEAHAMTLGPYVENTSERHSRQEAQYTWCVKKTSSGSSLDYYSFTDHEQVVNLPGFCMEGDTDVDEDEAGNVVTKYVIPASEQRKVLASLAQRNVNKCMLFGGTPDNLLEDLWNELVIDSAV